MSDARNRPASTPVTESRLDLPLVHRGKVRDVYEVDDATLKVTVVYRVLTEEVLKSVDVEGSF